MKFTCRAFYARTIYHDGSEVVDLKKAIVDEMPKRRYLAPCRGAVDLPACKEINTIAALLINFEMRDVRTLDKLTCSLCARSKPNGPKGFADQYFVQRQPARYCNACVWQALPGDYLPRPLIVLGTIMRYCGACRMVVRNNRWCSDCGDDDAIWGDRRYG